MRMKRKFLTMVVILLFMGSHMLSASNVQYIKFIMDGQPVFISLEEHPVITYTNNTLNVSTANGDIFINVANVTDFGFSESNSTDGIKKILLDKLTVFSNVVCFTQLLPNSEITVFSANGQEISTQYADSDGNAVINLSELSVGVYLVKTNRQTIKVSKNK